MIQCPSCNHRNHDGDKFCSKCGVALVRAPRSDADRIVGKIIAGKFRIDALIGEGGMGKVYRATHLALDKVVVLKVLRASLLGDPRTVARFQREAKAASRLNHPNSISVIDFGQSAEGSLYIAMEHVAGEDLHQLLSREGPLPQKRICRIVRQVLSALADAHAAGVIHRDLKPENIMVEQRRGEPDFVKVLDFGIAKIQESDGDPASLALTRTGFVCGTPEYMSPEQARGLPLDARSDLYAVGVILYQCATTMLPFEGDSAMALATMHLTQPPEPPRKKWPDAPISAAMEALILKALEKDPDRRPRDAETLARELSALEDEREEPKAPRTATHTRARRAPVPSRRPGDEARSKQRGLSSCDDETVVTSKTKLPSSRRKARRSTALIFAAALFGTAFVTGGGLLAYDRFAHRVRTVPAMVPAPPASTPVNPQTLEETKRREARRAQELCAQGDLAVEENRPDEAVSSYLQAYEVSPSPGIAKRVTLAYLRKSDAASSTRWLETYLKDAPGAADASLIERYLRAAAR